MRLNRSRGGAAIAGATVALLMLSACTSDPAEESENADQVAVSYPLDEYLGGVWGLSPEQRNERRSEVQALRDELVVQCMRDAGFEWIPWAASGVTSFPSQPADRDWATKWGYGIVDSPTGGILFWQPSGEASDPNAAIVADLSPEQLRSYLRALHGAIVDGDAYGTPGCLVEADQQTPESIWHLEEFAPLLAALSEAQVADVPDVREANKQWSQCMADAGFPGIDSPQAAAFHVQASAPRAPGLTPESPEMAAFREREIAQATADIDCRLSVDLETRVSAARHELEARFVEDHREILVSARDTARELGIVS